MNRRGLAAALLLTVALGLSACSAPQGRRLLEDYPAQAPRTAEITAVPFVASPDTLCGPTSLAMLLGHAGLDYDLEELTRQVYLPGREGALQAEMLAALRARDLVPYRLAPQLSALIDEVRAGNPVLVLQNLGLSWYPRWHYAVVVGFDLDRRVFILRSGELARRETGLTAFENTWARAAHWAVVASPPEQPPASANWLDWLRAARDLRQTGRIDTAREAIRAAARRWSDEPAVLMTAANSEIEAGDLLAAEYLLRMSVSLAPENPEAWNNLAHTLGLRGCGEAARRAARCAIRIDPQRELFRQTLREALQALNFNRCETLECPVF